MSWPGEFYQELGGMGIKFYCQLHFITRASFNIGWLEHTAFSVTMYISELLGVVITTVAVLFFSWKITEDTEKRHSLAQNAFIAYKFIGLATGCYKFLNFI